MHPSRTRPPDLPLDGRDKGVPGNVGGIEPARVGSLEWNILNEDLPFPVAVLKQEALTHNRNWMRAFVERHGVRLAPHGKTTMSPSLFDLQLADGAWAITVGTAHQIQVARHFGYQRIVLANQLIGRSAIEYVLREMTADEHFEFYCLVDSVASVEQLARVAKRLRPPRPISVLVEMGYQGGRTGCRTLHEGLEVARAVAGNPHATKLCGIEGYEGLIQGSSAAETTAKVEAFLNSVIELARLCEAEGYFRDALVLLSAGGSAHFDLVAKIFSQPGLSSPTQVLLRSGCYLTHDSLLYAVAFEQMKRRSAQLDELGAGLRPVIEVWAYVQSRPEAGLAIVGMGKRDVSYDDLPLPLMWFRPGAGGATQPTPMPAGHRVQKLNDQHGYLELPPNSPLQVGDLVGFGVSHPCLTFDKWRVLHIVAADYTVVESVRTYF
jgi:D-serine dehydratase